MTSFADFFARNQGSLTNEQQLLLSQKKVAVIGCGGLGGYVIEELVRIGVGRLHLFDPDVFTPSNCNRQLNALIATLGQNKAQTAAVRAAAIHPFNRVRAFAADFRSVGEEEPLQVDAVVDCLDNIQARRDLAALCNRRGISLVHGAVNGWYGQVGVQLAGFDLIERLYPQRMTSNALPSVLSFTVAVIASLQAAETVKLLLGLPSSMHNNWMHIDLKTVDFLVHGHHDSGA
jgi:molybdopterin-synthase adenylyltransferase